MPRLFASGAGALHEQLVVVQLDVVGTQKVRHPVDDRGVARVAPEHLVAVRDRRELADRQHLIHHGSLSFPERPFELDTIPGDVSGSSGRHQIGVIGQPRDSGSGDHVLHGKKAVDPE